MYEDVRVTKKDESELDEAALLDVKAGLDPKAFSDETAKLVNEHNASKNEGG